MIITRSPLRISLGGGGTDSAVVIIRSTPASCSPPPSTSTCCLTLHQTFVPELIISIRNSSESIR